jgi:hypothetical protein
MKKYTLIFAVACLGGLAAIGLNKLFGGKQSATEFTQMADRDLILWQ